VAEQEIPILTRETSVVIEKLLQVPQVVGQAWDGALVVL
jgi:hypothetical protein